MLNASVYIDLHILILNYDLKFQNHFFKPCVIVGQMNTFAYSKKIRLIVNTNVIQLLVYLVQTTATVFTTGFQRKQRACKSKNIA